MSQLIAADVHSTLGDSGWLAALEQLGVPAEHLRNRHGPCPLCGGKDRYRFDGKGRGAYYCNGCGAGDGFKLLQRLHGWDFRTALARVTEVSGLVPGMSSAPCNASKCQNSTETIAPVPATPSRRVLHIRRETCNPGAVADAVSYLTSRALWPLPAGCMLRAHESMEYWEGRERIGRFPALVADVVDTVGELITAHVTYLQDGKKLAGHEPRKILTKLEGRTGCAVRLMPLAADVLGIGEGLETMLAAHQLHGIPTWAAVNAGLLAKFEPPKAVRTLIVFADRDIAGLEAACRLFERLQGRVRLELRVPCPPAKDWNDVLLLEASPKLRLRTKGHA